jgi:hypothetical protein
MGLQIRNALTRMGLEARLASSRTVRKSVQHVRQCTSAYVRRFCCNCTPTYTSVHTDVCGAVLKILIWRIERGLTLLIDNPLMAERPVVGMTMIRAESPLCQRSERLQSHAW